MALLLASLLGGVTAWLHSHGTSGIHVHVWLVHLDHEDAEARGSHEHAHEHSHELAHENERGETGHGHPADEPAPGGVRIELPELLVAATRGSPSTSTAALATPTTLSRDWRLAPAPGAHRPEMFRSGWPPQWGGRSGVAALLTTSRAIRI